MNLAQRIQHNLRVIKRSPLATLLFRLAFLPCVCPATPASAQHLAAPDPPGLHSYRTAQQALSNMVEHTRASHVELSLNCATATPGVDRKPLLRVELRVGDDGHGLTAPAPNLASKA